MGCSILRGGVLFEEVADFEVEVWEVGGEAEPVVVASMSGKTMILRPLRTARRLLNWDLPPVASHRFLGIRAAQMMAVFSDSTRATVGAGDDGDGRSGRP